MVFLAPQKYLIMMYGRLYASLYEGSMVGAGSCVFAVWGYVIAKQQPDRVVGAQVVLNPRLLSSIIGDTPENISAAIDFLCSPDESSRSSEADGRRLVRLAQFDYQVVNGRYYMELRNAEDKRARDREAQTRSRDKKKVELLKKGPPLPGQSAYEKLDRAGAPLHVLDAACDPGHSGRFKDNGDIPKEGDQ